MKGEDFVKIQYWGTAATEGIPAVFCGCETCRRSLAAGGRNLRTRSQALIDDTILIDFPADTFAHMLRYGVSLADLNTCIVTHHHSDHLYAPEIENARIGYAHGRETPFVFYAPQPACRMLSETLEACRMQDEGRIGVQPVTSFVPFEAEGHRIIPLKAAHDPACQPVIYIVEHEGQALLYANDTWMFPEETWAFLETYGGRFGFVSLDCTNVRAEGVGAHMGLESDRTVRDRLCSMGLADSRTIFVLNHFSHNGKTTYDEMETIARDNGFLTSYDGMTVTF